MVPIQLAVDVQQSVSNLEQLGINILMVLGAFVAGFAATWIGMFFARKYIHKKHLPHGVNRFGRILGGLTAAILVALWVFVEGDGGFGEYGGDQEGGASQQAKGSPDTNPKLKKDADKPVEDPKKPGPGEVDPEYQAEVIVIGGTDDVGERYYMLASEYKEITFKQLTSQLDLLLGDEEQPLKSIKIFFRGKELPRNHLLVTQLERWASDQGLDVNYPPTGERMK